jgi:hypothetical protein
MESEQRVQEAAQRKTITYDGEGYTRESLEKMLGDYQTKNALDLEKFGQLSQAYQRLTKEMTRDVSDQKTAFEYLSNIVSLDNIGSNIKGLLHKIPIAREVAPSRDLKELLGEKIEIAQRRIKEAGNYLDTLQADMKALQEDVVSLNKRMIVAAQNEEKAAHYVLELEEARKSIELKLAATDPKSLDARTLASDLSDIKRLIWEHGGKLRLYSNAEDRLATIIKMNNNFLEIMNNLDANMTSLYDSGNEVLNELLTNLAGLASLSKAGEVSVAMHESMESLKKSVNRLATLASETSLYLTQNIDRLTAEMKIYDVETQRLIESNLAQEREMKEQRINETIELARQEYAHFEKARNPS